MFPGRRGVSRGRQLRRGVAQVGDHTEGNGKVATDLRRIDVDMNKLGGPDIRFAYIAGEDRYKRIGLIASGGEDAARTVILE